MSLIPGTRLGPYEVIAQLGVGGMGEVYRATDTNLKRQVAIKVLPASVAGDADRLVRFQREAEVLAALNHPNIAQIHGLEKSDGATALVMELVEGPTLADRIAQGPIAVAEALPIAKQIAEALDAAHEQGIIHRDLKPANIKVRPDGTVKVLDFGLAKALGTDAASAAAGSQSKSPTITTPAMTQAGMILGTAAYMSPEQARGKVVDKRADIWAFGAVLFEMLTGQRAFGGEDLTVTLARVVEREPDFDALPSSVPSRVTQAVRVCLRKDQKQRAGDIRDVRLALEGAFETAAPQTAIATATPAARSSLAWVVAGISGVALVAALVAWAPWRPASVLTETRTDIITPATDQPTSFALSPDGRQIVFVASGEGGSRLWLRSLAATTAQPLAGTEGATHPFWSPDSRSIGFFAEAALRRLDLGGGGAPQTLAPITTAQGGTWNVDGVIVFGPGSASPLMRVSAAGGTTTAVTRVGQQQAGHVAPHFLPDGHRFLFYARGAPNTAGIYLGALDGSAPTRLTVADSAGTYLPSGWLLWVRTGSQTLLAQRLDAAKAALTGDPVTLADGVQADASFRSAVSVAASGLVAYRTGGNGRLRLTWMDRSGTARGTIGDPDSSLSNPRVSPDGRRVAVERTAQGNVDLWLLDGSRTTRFTFHPASDRRPVWSPDGTRIAFSSLQTGSGDLYQKLTSGAGAEERIVASDRVMNTYSWSADGRFLLYNSTDPQTNTDIWVVPMVGDRTPSVFLKTPYREISGVFSPDGRWVAYGSNESGRQEIYVRPFVQPGAASTAAGAPGGQWQVSTEGGAFPAWRPDGKELYYLNPSGTMMAAPIAVNGATLVPGAPVMLFPTRIAGGGVEAQQGRQYDVAPDGRFLINTELESAAAPITLVQHWNPEAQK